MTVQVAPPLAQQRLLASWNRTGSASLAAHVSVYGPLAAASPARPELPGQLIDDVGRAGLTGRGVAAFPTARKLEAARRGSASTVIVNAMEGEPASQKDRCLLSTVPHLVLDGAELVAAAIGAREIVICVADDRDDVAARLDDALEERAVAGLPAVAVRVHRPPGRYVAGEESALVAWLNGGPPRPTFRPDKSVALRVRRRPVLVHNPETLADVALIARFGPDWFRSVGQPDAPGTVLVTVSGGVERPGVYEVATGTPIGSILEPAGLPSAPAAVLVGGYGGTWLPGRSLATPYASGTLAAVGASMGAGVLAPIDDAACGIAETAAVAAFMAGESAGQCGPCVFGLAGIADDLSDLAAGRADRAMVRRVRDRLSLVEGRGACRHPDGAVRLVRSALAVFADDVERHASHQPCAGSEARRVLAVPVPVAGRRLLAGMVGRGE